MRWAKGTLFRAFAFWLAVVVSLTLLVLVMGIAAWVYRYVNSHPRETNGSHGLSLTLTYGALILIASGLFLGVIFGWRHERREARDLRRQFAELQRKHGHL